MSVSQVGDWGPLSLDLEKAFSDATREFGEQIVTTFKRHFEAQDLGWAPHATATMEGVGGLSGKKEKTARSLRGVSKKELAARAGKLNIDVAGLGRQGMVAALATHGGQVLVDTGLLGSSFTFKQLAPTSGQVGVMRAAANGANIAAIHEYGAPSKHIPPRPFVKPVGDEMESKMAGIYGKYLEGIKFK